MGSHINKDGKFQSDKYPTCPAGKVPLSVEDPTAQPLLWKYAQIRRGVDEEFADDLETALKNAGYVSPSTNQRIQNIALPLLDDHDWPAGWWYASIPYVCTHNFRGRQFCNAELHKGELIYLDGGTGSVFCRHHGREHGAPFLRGIVVE